MVRSPDASFWRGKQVLITGHTGFKGGWLALWLARLGAKVHGLSLDPPTNPCFFDIAHISKSVTDIRGDIRDLATVNCAIGRAEPDVIFHLAAQPLVRASYDSPLATLSTNVIGTANMLEAARGSPTVRAVVIVTTDKCYENREWVYPYRETDALGGSDPYSGSKACAEIVSNIYRKSFLAGSGVAVATARAGNVIGGGDWAVDRLVPDCLRAFSRGVALELRYPAAVRPWQHVLEPLSGYLILAESLHSSDGAKFSGAWNFGPDRRGFATVMQIARSVAAAWGEGDIRIDTATVHPPEATLLQLDISKSVSSLRWRPRWSIECSLKNTVSWYSAWRSQRDMRHYSESQIDDFARDEEPADEI